MIAKEAQIDRNARSAQLLMIKLELMTKARYVIYTITAMHDVAQLLLL